MSVAGGGDPERLLKRQLPGRGSQQIASADDRADTLGIIIDHDREMIGEGSIAPFHDEIPKVAQFESLPAKKAIVPADLRSIVNLET